MHFSKFLVVLGLFMAAVQQAQADIAPDPRPPGTDSAVLFVVAGVCLSLAIVFFGLWFVNLNKQKRAQTLASQERSMQATNDFDPVSHQSR
jgi:hypothetical protein